MTDDIVTRLREKYSGRLPICLEAADEIERLRLVITCLQNEVLRLDEIARKVESN